MKSKEDKFQTVIRKNTFYYSDNEFEELYESDINSLKETLLIVKNKIETEGLRKEIFEWLLKEKENGLKALLTLTGFSNENLKRLITTIRIVDDQKINNLVFKDKWCGEMSFDNVQEWSNNRIQKEIQGNKYFRKGLVNIFFEGASTRFITNAIPLFELKKLSRLKLNFEIPELIDTLIRYKEKGSYSAKKENNPEKVIGELLKNLNLKYETGDLKELIDGAPDEKRTMDFIIPSKENPLIIIESSFLVTTSSSQGDKSKTEISVSSLIKKYFPNSQFIGFIDGIGWYVRKRDLKRMVAAYGDVFTFHKDELQRFKQLLIETFSNER